MRRLGLRAVKIKVQIPRILQKSSADEFELNVDGTTMGDLLVEVERQDPELYRSICNETGRLRQHINLFVNNNLFDRNRFDTSLEPGDVVVSIDSMTGWRPPMPRRSWASC